MHRYKQYPAGQPTSTSTATTTAPSGNVNSHSIYGSHPAQVPRSFSSPYYLRNSYQMSPSLPKSRSATSVQSMVSSNNTALPPKNPPDRYHRRRSVTSTVLESSLDNNNNKQQTPSPAASVGKLPKPEVPTTEAPRQKLMKVHSDTSATINKHQKPDTSTAHISKVAAKQATSQQQQHKPRQSTNGSIKPPQKRASVQQGKFIVNSHINNSKTGFLLFQKRSKSVSSAKRSHQRGHSTSVVNFFSRKEAKALVLLRRRVSRKQACPQKLESRTFD
ncbi:hypothetical protein TRICI_004918 [Trichomonascus ciferrii]|uniref:Uncharacterized protein n=1 Tax=Trichomonascus ciferrii TaxID=44093 RepID=A0A642UZL8_9ASCO|nr:hypothetical protein TRICI_004918 [Trichomonascus ciferrii]